MTRLTFAVLAAALIYPGSKMLTAQTPQRPIVGSIVQLPEISFFHINTAVSVPDGGAMFLGGVARGASGRAVSGMFPSTRSAGSTYAGGGVSVHATILSNSEIDEFLTAEGNRLSAIRAAQDPNGPAAIQRQADFLSRHMGGN